MSKPCPKCNFNNNPDDARFCGNCGNELVVQVAASEDVKRPAIGRNDPCPCGSGKKFKNCHGRALKY